MAKTLLVTGAAGGLGRAIAEVFLKNGWKVIATDSADHLTVSGENDSLFKIRMDVTDDTSVREVYRTLRNNGLFLDLVINNAGIDRYFPFSQASAEEFREVFEVNLFGGYRVNQVFLPLLKKPGGRILHIGSESLNLVVPFMPYPISKKALESYAKALRQELHFAGIEVAVVRPGPIKTAFVENLKSIRYVVEDPVIETIFRNFALTASKKVRRIIEPVKAAEFIYTVAMKKRLKPVYCINRMFMLRFFRLFPFSLSEKVIYLLLKKRLPLEQPFHENLSKE